MFGELGGLDGQGFCFTRVDYMHNFFHTLRMQPCLEEDSTAAPAMQREWMLWYRLDQAATRSKNLHIEGKGTKLPYIQQQN
jgi:hypothetical protein